MTDKRVSFAIVRDIGPCPCGQAVAVEVESEMVVHNEPYCKEWLRLERADFIEYVLESMRRQGRGVLQ